MCYAFGGAPAPGRVRIAQRSAEGVWDAEEIYHAEKVNYNSYGVNLYDLSLRVSPSGKKAVAFIHEEKLYHYDGFLDYRIMADDGSGWHEVFLGHQLVMWAAYDYPDFRYQDIAYSADDQLYALFTREHLVGGGDDHYRFQTISLARRTGGGWEEHTIWQDEVEGLYGHWGTMDNYPHLLAGEPSRVKVVYTYPRGYPRDAIVEFMDIPTPR